MSDWPLWRSCKHPKTPENTIGRVKKQCRTCHHRHFKDSTPQERYDAYRARYLPQQIEATKRKLHALQHEADRRGIREPLSTAESHSSFPATGGTPDSAPVNGEPSFQQRVR